MREDVFDRYNAPAWDQFRVLLSVIRLLKLFIFCTENNVRYKINSVDSIKKGAVHSRSK